MISFRRSITCGMCAHSYNCHSRIPYLLLFSARRARPFSVLRLTGYGCYLLMNLSLSLSLSISHMKNTADFFLFPPSSTDTHSLLLAYLHTISRPSVRGQGCLSHDRGHRRDGRAALSPSTRVLAADLCRRHACIDNAVDADTCVVRSLVCSPSLFLSPSFLFPHFNICSQPYQTVCRLSSSFSPGAATRPSIFWSGMGGH